MVGRSCAGRPMVASQLAAVMSSSVSLPSSSHADSLVGTRGRLTSAPVIKTT